jgi:hypothetical protein
MEHTPMTTASPSPTAGCFQIRFRSAFLHGQSMAFPCDERGEVDMDLLSEAGRRDYLFARVITRRDCTAPEIVATPTHKNQ